MIVRRYIECALRLKWRLLIGAVLIFGLVNVVLYFSKQGYSSSATVWVEQPLYLDIGTQGWNQYLSPAQNQANILNELLQTRQFSLKVAQGATIPMPTDAAEAGAVSDIQHGVRTNALGTHLIEVTYNSSTPSYCMEVVSQVIQLFTEQLNSNRQSQATVALTQYEGQQDTYQKAWEKSRDALTNYRQTHPESVTPGGVPDPTLIELQQQYEADRTRLEDITQRIDAVQLNADAANKVSEDFFRVVDVPAEPAPYRLNVKQLLTNSVVGGGMAVFLMLALVLVGAWLDPTLHTLADVSTVAATEDISGTASAVLVAAAPANKGLAGQRKAAAQAAKAASRAAKGQPVAPTPDLASVPGRASLKPSPDLATMVVTPARATDHAPIAELVVEPVQAAAGMADEVAAPAGIVAVAAEPATEKVPASDIAAAVASAPDLTVVTITSEQVPDEIAAPPEPVADPAPVGMKAIVPGGRSARRSGRVGRPTSVELVPASEFVSESAAAAASSDWADEITPRRGVQPDHDPAPGLFDGLSPRAATMAEG